MQLLPQEQVQEVFNKILLRSNLSKIRRLDEQFHSLVKFSYIYTRRSCVSRHRLGLHKCAIRYTSSMISLSHAISTRISGEQQ